MWFEIDESNHFVCSVTSMKVKKKKKKKKKSVCVYDCE